MNIINILIAEVFDKISFTEYYFTRCIIYNFVIIIFMMIIPHLELKWKLLTRIFKKKWRAADAFAYLFINIGSARFYYFVECVLTQEKFILDSKLLMAFALIGSIFIIIGSYLIVSGFKLLGLRGMYFGDHFGYVLPHKIEKFPYDQLEDPQYFGIKLVYFGISIAYVCPAGLILSLILLLSTQLSLEVERRKLMIFYPNSNPNSPIKTKND